ncbi:hypothetical protein BAUCODRAFT_41198, partial [Baudoinia panamericana UAMH 10762]
INYLARQSQDDLPLLNKDDTLPNLLQLLIAYNNVLERHESLASNLGARPLGPILIKRFERCFDAPPKVVASHHKGASSTLDENVHHITWFEVIEFARAHPSQFTLSTFSEGERVCQFYYPQKQLRVQISEEDFLFISSGRCQELIPPLPIWEDEEKELGTCDVLEAKLKELTNVADIVAARTRQLSHKLKGRKVAILERRAEGGSGTPAKVSAQQTTTAPPSASASGFTAVNTANGRLSLEVEANTPSLAASTTPRPPQTTTHGHRPSMSISGHTYNVGPPPSKHNFSRPLPPALESSQPFRPLCQAHMDSLPRGHRVLPPCDRCRRLRMDCVKNLTSCAGCTKKHARCHWRDVSRDELSEL